MTPPEQARKPGRSIVAWGAIPVVLLAGLLSVDHIPGTDISLAVPYAAEGPGPMFDTLSEVQGEPVVRIDGADTDPTSGALNMTTVSVRTNMTLPQALTRWIAHGDTLVPVEQVIPKDVTHEELREYNQQAFVASEASATVAAMHYLGRPTRVVVHSVVEDSAAAGVLRDGDTLKAVAGTAVTTPAEVQELVRAHKPGDTLDISVARQGTDGTGSSEHTETVTLGKDPNDDTRALLGILMTSEPDDDVEVTYNLQDVGGPSAGMIFALAVIDKLSPGELTGGHAVAGTGTINDAGEVGPIGGITHKIDAAREGGIELFLAPEGNCGDIRLRNSEGSGGMTIAAVKTLDDAVAAMEDFAAGRDVQTCPAR